MKKSIGFLGILMIFLVSLVFSVNAITSVTGIPTSVSISEDTVDNTAIGDLNIVASLGGVVGTVTWSATNSANIQVSIDTNNVTTLTPATNFVGTETIIITATDGGNSTSINTNVNVIVTNVNDTPVLSLVNKKAHEDLQFVYENYATDVDTGDTLTYAYEVLSAPSDSTFTSTNFNAGTGKIIWIPEEEDVGELELKINVSDGTVTETGTFTIDVYPDFMCDEGEKGSGLDLKIDEPDNGDDFALGERINLEVNIDNDATDMDVVVEAFLYNVDQNDKVDEAESDSIDIDDRDDYDFDESDGLSLKIPYDLEFDDGDEFRIYFKAYEDGDEDKYCISDSIEIEIEREDDAVIIEEARLSLSTVNPGESTVLVVDLLNIGSRDQDDVTVRVVRSDLKIDLISDRFDLDEFEDSDNDATEKFTLNIPTTAKPGEYSIEVAVLDEDEDVYDVDMATEFVTLTVTGEALAEEASLELIKTNFEQKPGDSFSLPVKVVNDGTIETTYIVEVFPVGGWTDTVTKIVSLESGKETIVYPALTVKSGLSEGSYTVLVSLKSQGGETLDSESVSVTVEGKGITSITGGVTYSATSKWFDKGILTSIFWIIGDLALVVIVIYFVKLIFIKPR